MLNNPILQFEYKRITTAVRKTTYSRIRILGYTALVALTLIAVGSLLLFPNVPFMRPNEVSFIATPILILQTILMLVLLQRTLLRATLIVGRERTSTWNWEAFVLTGIDARTTIIGKWKAVLRSLWQEFLLLGLLRAVVFPVAMMLHRIHSEYPFMRPGQYSLGEFVPPLPRLLFGLVAVVLLTLAQLPLMAAIGVLAASRRSTHPACYGRALSTWLFISMGTSIVILLLFFAYNQYVYFTADIASQTYSTWLAVERGAFYPFILCAVAVADTGTLSPFALITFTFSPDTFEGIGIIGFSTVLAVYSFLTWAALRLSIRLSFWQGMMRPNSP